MLGSADSATKKATGICSGAPSGRILLSRGRYRIKS